jgi:hypothetical protein
MQGDTQPSRRRKRAHGAWLAQQPAFPKPRYGRFDAAGVSGD